MLRRIRHRAAPRRLGPLNDLFALNACIPSPRVAQLADRTGLSQNLVFRVDKTAEWL